MDTALAVGRILLVIVFVVSGVNKFGDLFGTASYIASKGLPLPMVGAVAAAVAETVGGLMIAVGWQTRLAALALALFTAVAGYFFHDFWNFPAAQQAGQMAHFLKNVAIVGALIMLAAVGPGRFALEGRRRR